VNLYKLTQYKKLLWRKYMKKKNIQRVSALIILALIIFLFRPAYTPSITGSESISKLVSIRVGGQN
jgi:hypothetical protein